MSTTASARLAIAAIVTYQLLLLVLIVLRPDLDPSWHTISEWAIGPYGWLMSAAFFISAVSYAALAFSVGSQLRNLAGRAGLLILILCVIGAAGVSVFTTDPMPIRPPLSTRGTLHVLFGTTQLVFLPFAALLINLSLLRNERWVAARRSLRWTAGVPLSGFLMFVLYSAIFVAPHGRDAYGPGVNIGWPPRLAFLTYAIWVVTIGWNAIRVAAPRHSEPRRRRRIWVAGACRRPDPSLRSG